MWTTATSPRITYLAWGRLQIDDGRRFKDAKLFPGGAREWDWAESGTSHETGIQLGDVQELLDHGAEVIVLSLGMLERLRIDPALQHTLARRGVTVHALRTEDAVRLYNQLSHEQAVGALIHSTC